MFGHDNQQHHDTTLPAPDGNLADNQQMSTTPQINDTAGDFLDDVGTPSTPPTVTMLDSQTDDARDNTPAAGPAPSTGTDQLLDIKQQALQQLTPLIGHLDQNPEEKFRTTMMMIQAADNHELIQTAYEAAQQIEDEKVRAQALLDIVNEINYFTHNNPQESPGTAMASAA